MITPGWLCRNPSRRTATTCARFLHRAAEFFTTHGIEHIERVMTDNAPAYRRSHAGRDALEATGAQARFTRRYRPQTNGNAERSIEPCRRMGLPNAPTPATPNEPPRYRYGYTPTTTTAPTQPSTANHPSVASTTLLRTTPSAVAGHRDPTAPIPVRAPSLRWVIDHGAGLTARLRRRRRIHHQRPRSRDQTRLTMNLASVHPLRHSDG